MSWVLDSQRVSAKFKRTRLFEGKSRYIPTEGEAVVGLITERYGDSWNVDIRGPFPAKLDALAFEGVSRRSRPNLQPGDLVYARVTAAPRDANPEIVCMDDSGLVSPLSLRFFPSLHW